MQVEERIKQDKAESAHLTTTPRKKGRTIKERKIRMLRIQHHRRNKRNNLMINVSSVVLLGIKRSNVLNIMHGVQRKVCFLIWLVLRLIYFRYLDTRGG